MGSVVGRRPEQLTRTSSGCEGVLGAVNTVNEVYGVQDAGGAGGVCAWGAWWEDHGQGHFAGYGALPETPHV